MSRGSAWREDLSRVEDISRIEERFDPSLKRDEFWALLDIEIWGFEGPDTVFSGEGSPPGDDVLEEGALARRQGAQMSNRGMTVLS